AFLLGEGEVIDIVTLGQHGAADLDQLGAGLHIGLGQLRGRILELQAVDEYHVGATEHPSGAWRRVERVRVGALGYQAIDDSTITGDIGYDRSDRRDRGYHM